MGRIVFPPICRCRAQHRRGRAPGLTKESFDDLADEVDLQVLFVTANIEVYINEPAMLGLDEDFLDRLLEADLTDENKVVVIGLMDLDSVIDRPERAALIGPIIDRTNFDVSGLTANVAKSLITHSAPLPTRISLLNKANASLADDDVRQILAALPAPYSDIKTGYYARLDNNPENRTLLSWLDTRKIISSWSVESPLFLTEYLRVNLYRR